MARVAAFQEVLERVGGGAGGVVQGVLELRPQGEGQVFRQFPGRQGHRHDPLAPGPGALAAGADGRELGQPAPPGRRRRLHRGGSQAHPQGGGAPHREGPAQAAPRAQAQGIHAGGLHHHVSVREGQGAQQPGAEEEVRGDGLGAQGAGRLRAGPGRVGARFPALPVELFQDIAPKEGQGLAGPVPFLGGEGPDGLDAQRYLPAAQDQPAAAQVQHVAQPGPQAAQVVRSQGQAPGPQVQARQDDEEPRRQDQGPRGPAHRQDPGRGLERALAQGRGGFPGELQQHGPGPGHPGCGPRQEVQLGGGDGGGEEQQEAHEEDLAALGQPPGQGQAHPAEQEQQVDHREQDPRPQRQQRQAHAQARQLQDAPPGFKGPAAPLDQGRAQQGQGHGAQFPGFVGPGGGQRAPGQPGRQMVQPAAAAHDR